MKRVRRVLAITKPNKKLLTKPQLFKLGFAGLFALIMVLVLSNLHAATFVNGAEAENGTVTGSASKIDDSTSSGGKSVRFGGDVSALAAPTNIKAWTGGDSIALVWQMPAGGVRNIEVYRNNGLVVTLTPGVGVLKSDLQANRYIDKNVTRGTTYSYQLRAIGTNGSISPMTAAVTATHPSSLKTPIPNVVVDSSLNSTYKSYLNTSIVPEIKTWYPKIGDFIVNGGYTPYSGTITIQPDANCDCVAYVGGGMPAGYIKVGTPYLEIPGNGEEGMFLHESTHILQGYDGNSSQPSWPATESIADWTREWFMYERYQVYSPNSKSKLATGYSEGSYMLQWASYKYNWPTVVHDVNVAVRKGTYSDSIFTNKTGKTPAQLYTEMKSQFLSPNPGTLTGIAGKCAIIAGASSDSGAKIQLGACGSSTKWQIQYAHLDLLQDAKNGTKPSTFSLANTTINSTEDKCLDVTSSGTADGTIVQSWGCNGSNAQVWSKGSDGSLINFNSGKCLTATGNASADGTQLIISACNGSPGQKWTPPSP